MSSPYLGATHDQLVPSLPVNGTACSFESGSANGSYVLNGEYKSACSFMYVHFLVNSCKDGYMLHDYATVYDHICVTMIVSSLPIKIQQDQRKIMPAFSTVQP